MTTEYIPLKHFQETDDDHSTSRIRDMPYGKQREALALYPDEVAFGNMVVDRISSQDAVLLSNTGYDDVFITEITVVGDFVYNGPYINKIKANETISLQVAFYPQQEGPVTGGLYVTAPTAVGDKFISFTGSGVLTEDDLMQYPLIQRGKVTTEAMNIANGVYAYAVSETFDGASVRLQWRTDSSGSWIDIPNTTLSAVDTIYGIPLNTGQARIVIDNAGPLTSLTVILKW